MDPEVLDVNEENVETPVNDTSVNEETPVEPNENDREVQTPQEVPADGSYVPRSRLNEQKEKFEREVDYWKGLASQGQPQNNYPQGYAPAPVPPQAQEQIPADVYSQDPTTGEWVIDPNKFISWNDKRSAQVADQRVNQILSQREAAQREENEALKEFPELKENSKLMDFVKGAQLNQFAQTKKFVPLKDIAKDLFGEISKQKQEAAKAQTESVRIQNSAHLESGSVKMDAEAQQMAKLQSDINSDDPKVAREARVEMIAKLRGK